MKRSGRGSERIRAVIDTSIFVAAIYWRGSARECLVRFARREFEAVASESIFQEYAETAWELKIEENLAQNPQPWLNWLQSRVTILTPITLNESICADREDEKFIECALAPRAEYIISRDRELLRLKKPFGIRIVEDREFLAELERK